MKKKVLVCSYDEYYGTRKYGLHYLTDFLAEENDVIFITVRTLINDFAKQGLKFFLNREKFPKKYGNIINEIVYLILPPIQYFPILNTFWYAKYCLSYTFPHLGRILRVHSYKYCDILMFETNSKMAIMSHTNSRYSIYRLCDPYDGFKYISAGMLNYEKQVIINANLILAVNKPLFDYAVSIKNSSKGIYLLPNGVDTEIFHNKQSKPDEYNKIRTPIIVYVGTFPSWFDWNLLIKTAKIANEFTFALIGTGNIPNNLPANILYIGAKNHTEIPKYLCYANVGIIPFSDDPRLSYVETPLKYFEYLASGLPVVSVPFGNLKKMNFAFFAENPADFYEEIKKSMGISHREKRKYMKYAKENSWKSIQFKFREILKKEGIL